MSSIVKVNEWVWRWDGVDADHGFPIVGYVVQGNEGVVLVDPPGTSGTQEEVEACGRPEGILLTSRWHVRGAADWKQQFNIPIAAPRSAEDELKEVGATADHWISEGDEHWGWQALGMEVPGSDYAELAFWHAASGTVIIGDLFTRDESGVLRLGPVVFMGVAESELQPVIERLVQLKPRLLLSAHLGVVDDPASLLAELDG